MIVDGFEETSTLRFGTLDLVRSDWRKYTKNIAYNTATPDPTVPDNEGSVMVNTDNFYVGSVNLEENSLGTPPYVLPPGIQRQILSGTTGAQRQNEASFYMKFLNLGNDAKGAVKTTFVDMRRYQKLKLFVHAEDIKAGAASNNLDENAKILHPFRNR